MVYLQVTPESYLSARPDPVASFAPHVAGHMNGEGSHIQVSRRPSIAGRSYAKYLHIVLLSDHTCKRAILRPSTPAVSFAVKVLITSGSDGGFVMFTELQRS